MVAWKPMENQHPDRRSQPTAPHRTPPQPTAPHLTPPYRTSNESQPKMAFATSTKINRPQLNCKQHSAVNDGCQGVVMTIANEPSATVQHICTIFLIKACLCTRPSGQFCTWISVVISAHNRKTNKNRRPEPIVYKKHFKDLVVNMFGIEMYTYSLHVEIRQQAIATCLSIFQPA